MADAIETVDPIKAALCDAWRAGGSKGNFEDWYEAYFKEIPSMLVLTYEQYGNWSTTCGFRDRREVERHAHMYLLGKGNEYKKHVTIMRVPMPKGARAPLPKSL